MGAKTGSPRSITKVGYPASLSLRGWGSLPSGRYIHGRHPRRRRHPSALRHPLLQLLHLRLHHLLLTHLPARKYRRDELVDEEQDYYEENNPSQYGNSRADFALTPIATLLATPSADCLRHLIYLLVVKGGVAPFFRRGQPTLLGYSDEAVCCLMKVSRWNFTCPSANT